MIVWFELVVISTTEYLNVGRMRWHL